MHFLPPIRTLYVAWVIVVALCLSSISVAQQPDRGGWSSGPPSDISLNRPSTIEPLNRSSTIDPPPSLPLLPIQRAPASAPESPSDDIRDQIGLATFDSPIDSFPGAADGADAAQSSSQEPSSNSEPFSSFFSSQTDSLTSPEGLSSSIKVALLLATLSLAPAIILMTTCYIRVVVVLTLLKQAFGAQQLPPTQILTALSLFITLLVMTPVWTEVKTEAIDPYTQAENGISWEEAWQRGIVPVKKFMAKQINLADNGESIALFYKYLPDHQQTRPSSAQDVPINVLLPAFVVSELKVAFLLGFQIYLPFLVLDLVVASVTVSTGMMMLPPTMVSFPLKLILFVLVDGWNLVVGMLLQSFGPFT